MPSPPAVLQCLVSCIVVAWSRRSPWTQDMQDSRTVPTSHTQLFTPQHSHTLTLRRWMLQDRECEKTYFLESVAGELAFSLPPPAHCCASTLRALAIGILNVVRGPGGAGGAA